MTLIMLQKLTQAFNQRGYNKQVKHLEKLVTQINTIETEYQNLSEDELKAKTPEFRVLIHKKLEPFEKELKEIQGRYDEADEAGDLERKKELQGKIDEKKKEIVQQEQEVLDGILPEAFAVVKNACRRLVGKKFKVRGHELTWDMIPYDVQLIGGATLHQGKIAEMKTGEGKTLVATLPLYLNALTGKGAHVVTVNEYLAQRDAEWMGFLLQYLGLSVGIIVSGMDPEAKRAAYEADITYGTNNEFGFDYLRDNMATSPNTEVQRELHFAIVDEVDSILIDEARTPLIISAPAEQSTSKYRQYMSYVGQLTQDDHYIIDEKSKTATLTENGIKKMEEIMGVDNIYTEGGITEVHHLEQALRAQACYKRDVDYLVKDDQVQIVDEFTGRVLEGRRYSDGLHQAIEAKENVEIKRESRTLATITFQNLFRLYDKLAGMTGTALTESEEFMKIYGLDVLPIPTHKDVIRDDKQDSIYKTEEGKFQALAKVIKEKHEKGQPVLVGTIAIEKSEVLSATLKKAGVPHSVLNAKHHEKEAEIVANAGQKGAVTIATNMAGRGTDIKLGEETKNLGGLAIIGTERHESRRIDNQLRGRSGRQGDPGESQFFISMEDDLMRIFGGDRMKGMMEMLKIPEDMPIENKMISNTIESSQKRVEGHHFDMRKHVVQYDDVMNKHREIIYSRRKKILHKKSVRQDIIEMIHAFVQQTVFTHTANRSPDEFDIDTLVKEVSALHHDDTFDTEHLKNLATAEDLQEYLTKYLLEAYEEKEKALPDEKIMRDVERGVSLRTIDMLWMQHLDHMQSLRDAVALHGYGQKDPLVEYKREGFQAFEKLLTGIDHGVLQTLFRMEFRPREQEQLKIQETKQEASNWAMTDQQTNQEQVEDILTGDREGFEDPGKPTVVKLQGAEEKPKVGRNEPCPCGSGKKYKKCHGA